MVSTSVGTIDAAMARDDRNAGNFGSGVLESAAEDDRQAKEIGGHVVHWVIAALFGSGFLSCGILEMLSAK